MHIKLYKDEFPSYIWEEYCEILGVRTDSEVLKIEVADYEVLSYEENEND